MPTDDPKHKNRPNHKIDGAQKNQQKNQLKNQLKNQPPLLFDRQLYRRRRARAAARFADHDFLHRRAMSDIADRLETVTRQFETAAFFGAAGLEDLLTPKAGVQRIVHIDPARQRLKTGGPAERNKALYLVGDDEASPFAPASFDLVVSILLLHQTNDLIGALAQARQALKPDGLFIGVLFGEETLSALRRVFYEAETAETGGVSPRVSPFASVRDLGGALQRAGFALPVADVDRVRVAYRHPARLIEDLRGMGETNTLLKRGGPIRRTVAARAMAALSEPDADIFFDLVTLTGWAPAPSQQKPLKPGSAKHSLAAAVKGDNP